MFYEDFCKSNQILLLEFEAQYAWPQETSDDTGCLPVAGCSSDTNIVKGCPSLFMTFFVTAYMFCFVFPPSSKA